MLVPRRTNLKPLLKFLLLHTYHISFRVSVSLQGSVTFAKRLRLLSYSGFLSNENIIVFEVIHLGFRSFLAIQFSCTLPESSLFLSVLI